MAGLSGCVFASIVFCAHGCARMRLLRYSFCCGCSFEKAGFLGDLFLFAVIGEDKGDYANRRDYMKKRIALHVGIGYARLRICLKIDLCPDGLNCSFVYATDGVNIAHNDVR